MTPVPTKTRSKTAKMSRVDLVARKWAAINFVLQQIYFHYFQHFDEHQAFDTYIFCLTEHKPENNDGRLSMWRGYGQHGNGAALVFDASKVTIVPTSPLLFAKVSYVSNEKRISQVQSFLNAWSELTEHLALPTDKLYLASHVAFSLVKAHALTTKHAGFGLATFTNRCTSLSKMTAAATK